MSVANGMEAVEGFLKSIVCGLVDHPEDVKVSSVSATYRSVLELQTNPGDVGQVLGRGGNVVDSIRNLLAACSGKYKIKCDLDYVTEHENKPPERY